MKILKNCVILTLGEYEEYKRMKACINELQSRKKTDFIQPPETEEVEAWSTDQDSNQTMTSKNTSTTTASTKQQMKTYYA